MNLLPDDLGRGAIFDADRVYRYRLFREWREGKGVCAFLMLNPSTADERVLDPTVRRCVNYAKAWGYKQLEVINLFAYRSTDPDALLKEDLCGMDVVGPENDHWILSVAQDADLLVCAWGTHPATQLLQRAEHVRGLLDRYKIKAHALKITKIAKQPQHPLYLPKTLRPEPLVYSQST